MIIKRWPFRVHPCYAPGHEVRLEYQ